MTPTEQLLQGVVMDAWQRLLRANCVFLRTLDTELRATHGMTISDYDVLIQLRDAEGGALKMSELSRRTLLTRSGMTRLVQGLEQDGYVERRACGADARVSYATITERGLEHLAAARCTHHAGIRRVFADHFSDDDAEQLARLLDKIPGVADGFGACPSTAPQ